MDKRYCPISYGAKECPNAPALVTKEKIWTYRACNAHVQGVCAQLSTLGITSGSRVAFIARAHPSTIFLFFALFRLGAIACPLSFREPEEKRPQLIDALAASHYLEPEKLVVVPTPSDAPVPVSPDALATFLFTSGSSGNPKIACHTLGNHFYSAQGAIDFFSLNASSRWLLSLPLFHVGGMAILLRMFYSQGTLVLSELPLIEAIAAHQITHVSLAPTQLFRMLQSERIKAIATQLRCALVGGAPLAENVFRRAMENGIPIYTTYGMTEMSSIITAAALPTSLHTGKALAFRECTLSKEGEILVAGQTLFKGYWDKETKAVRDSEGWFATRDSGTWTDEGDLMLLGRMDRLFISGGENIQPEEIECALCCIPGIVSAKVVPVPDPEFGYRPVAYIQDATGQHSLETIRAALQPLLAPFKHPVRLLPLEKYSSIISKCSLKSFSE